MKEIAKILLKLKAVSLSPDDPFTWASGIKSPIYCDNRLILSYPGDRDKVEEGLLQLVREHFPKSQMIMGTATAGIPHAAIVAHDMGLPMGFVRGKAKDHGKQNAIEGHIEAGLPVVVMEDLISTGGSSLDVVKTLQAAGCQVLGVVAIFTYGMAKAEAAFQEAGVPFVTLTNYEELLEVAAQENYIRPDQVEKLQRFMADPGSSDWMKA